jgi:hypothetical protein
MALAVRSASSNVVPKSTGSAPQPPKASLPTTMSEPSKQLGDYSILIYGEKKIGKTSLAAQFPEALFMMFEPGGKGLKIYQQQIENWAHFKELTKLLRTSDQFQTIVIDIVDIAYDMCMTWTGQREGFGHPGDEKDFGKSWKKVEKEFIKGIYDLVGTGRGIIFISHAKESEFIPHVGRPYNKIIPSMTGQVRSFIEGFADIIAFYGYNGRERFLTISGSESLDAGHRLKDQFRSSTNPEEAIISIPMGKSSEEGYQNFMKAFNNEQELTHPQDFDDFHLTSTQRKK